jgi:thymidylate synthase ThyX
MYDCKILADSVGPSGVRLTTLEVTLPRIVLAEFNTHRVFARNSASSRAIPVEKQIKRVQEDPFIPIYWGKNQKGMQADVELTEEEQEHTKGIWRAAMLDSVQRAKWLLEAGVHKQITNRLLEPWMWHTIIATATDWANFFALRCHLNAQPEIRRAAEMMRATHAGSTPARLQAGEWHLPLFSEEDMISTTTRTECRPKVSVGRCARVSYLTHDGKRDLQADTQLHDDLLKNGHMSPFEHVAQAISEAEWRGREQCVVHVERTLLNGDYGMKPEEAHGVASRVLYSGNLRGWRQYRKTLPNEDVFEGEDP